MEWSTIKCLVPWEETCGLSNIGSKFHGHIIDPKVGGSELAVISLSDPVLVDPSNCSSVVIVGGQAETSKLAFER